MAHELVVTATTPCLLFTMFPVAFTLLAVAVVDVLVVMILVPVMMRVGGFCFTRSAGIVSQCSFARQAQQAQA
jgi:hypothetical protein